ncbi:MAG: AmmeMemoRadiSam system protein B [Thermoplasmata archaeon]|nr:AmmeMemoRadiSam system protein B [Thermoplasmata archaeon]
MTTPTGAFRLPAVAGQFYAADGRELAREVEACFLDARGPGELPTRHRANDRHIRAAIVPHAGLVYSGPIAALVYDRIASERPPATTVILGVNHHGVGEPAALSDVDWKTPLGPTPVDHDLVRTLSGHPPIVIDERAHRPEHSIEVQLPFLEYVLPRPRFVPLMIRYDTLGFLEQVAQGVRAAIANRDVLLLASTDFSHYIPAKEAERLDGLAIQKILEKDARGLYATVAENDISMCGIAPTTVLLSALMGENLETQLLRWGHSGEVTPMKEVVGYAAILVTSSAPLPTGTSQ